MICPAQPVKITNETATMGTEQGGRQNGRASRDRWHTSRKAESEGRAGHDHTNLGSLVSSCGIGRTSLADCHAEVTVLPRRDICPRRWKEKSGDDDDDRIGSTNSPLRVCQDNGLLEMRWRRRHEMVGNFSSGPGRGGERRTMIGSPTPLPMAVPTTQARMMRPTVATPSPSPDEGVDALHGNPEQRARSELSAQLERRCGVGEAEEGGQPCDRCETQMTATMSLPLKTMRPMRNLNPNGA